MREPRAILRSILRSYALRGLVGFGVCGLLMALVAPITSRGGETSSALEQVLANLTGFVAFFVGPAIAADLLMDDRRGKTRRVAAVIAAAVFVAGFFVGGVAAVGLTMLPRLVFPHSWYLMTPELGQGPSSGLLWSASLGLAAGFTSLFVKCHMRIRSVHPFWAWLVGFVGFVIGGAILSAVLWWQARPATPTAMPLYDEIAFFAPFVLGGLFFGLGLDLIAWRVRIIERRKAAHRMPVPLPREVVRLRRWRAIGVAAVVFVVVLIPLAQVYARLHRVDMAYGHSDKGERFRQAGKYEDAAREHGETVRLLPDNCGFHYDLGRVYLDLNRYDDAVHEYKEAIRIEPRSWSLHIRLGEAYARLRRNDDADREFKAAIRLNPKKVSVRTSLARTYEGLGRYDDAVSEYEEAIRLDPKDYNTHYELALMYDRLKRYDDEINQYEEAASINPRDSHSYATLGWILVKLKRYNQAIAANKRALELAPKSPDGHIGLGYAFAGQGRLADAVRECEAAVECDPTSAVTRWYLGEMYINAHDKANAMKQYGVLKTLDPARAESLLKDINKKP